MEIRPAKIDLNLGYVSRQFETVRFWRQISNITMRPLFSLFKVCGSRSCFRATRQC